MPEWIEFHDSTLTSISQTAAEVEVLIDAYVHRWQKAGDEWKGTGWMQPVRILIRGARPLIASPIMPVEVWTGRLTVGTVTHDNLCPVPLTSVAPANLWLHLITDDILELSGTAVGIETVGAARYIEDLPADLRPPQT